MTQSIQQEISCGRFGASYGFGANKDETLEQAAIRAAERIHDCGLKRVAHYRGTNHVAANNAAFAFSDARLAELDASDDLIVRAAAEVIRLRKETVTVEETLQEAAKEWGRNKREAMPLPPITYLSLVSEFAAKVDARAPRSTSVADEAAVKKGLADLCDEFEATVLADFIKPETQQGRLLANAFKNALEDQLSFKAKAGAMKSLSDSVTSGYDKMDEAVRRMRAHQAIAKGKDYLSTLRP